MVLLVLVLVSICELFAPVTCAFVYLVKLRYLGCHLMEARPLGPRRNRWADCASRQSF